MGTIYRPLWLPWQVLELLSLLLSSCFSSQRERTVTLFNFFFEPSIPLSTAVQRIPLLQLKAWSFIQFVILDCRSTRSDLRVNILRAASELSSFHHVASEIRRRPYAGACLQSISNPRRWDTGSDSSARRLWRLWREQQCSKEWG